MVKNRYKIEWVGRCVYDTSDKIWGWFTYNDPTVTDNLNHRYSYVFWASTGKTIQFKKHEYREWSMGDLVCKKKARNYNKIDIVQMLNIWPSFYEDLDNKFIFFMLVGDTNEF